MAEFNENTQAQTNLEEIVLGENEIVCALTNRVVKSTYKELTLQSMIAMMTEEYGFAPEDMVKIFSMYIHMRMSLVR